MVQYAVPNSTVSKDANWIIVGAATVHETVDEGINSGTPDNAATRMAIIRSTANIGDAFRVGLSDLQDPGTNNRTGHKLYVHQNCRDVASPAGAPGSLAARLYQGTTLIKNWGAPLGIPLTTAYGTVPLTLSEAEAQAITDYTDLEVEIRYLTLGTEEIANVSTIEFEVPDPFDHLAETLELEIDLPALEAQVEVPGTTAELEIDLPGSTVELEASAFLDMQIDLPAPEAQVEAPATILELAIDLPTALVELEGVSSVDMVFELPSSTVEVEVSTGAVEQAIDLPAATAVVDFQLTVLDMAIDLPVSSFLVETLPYVVEMALDLPTPEVQVEVETTAPELVFDLPPVVAEIIGGGGDVDIQLTVLDMAIDLPETSIQIEVSAAVQELVIEPFGAFELDIQLTVLEAVIEILPVTAGGDVLVQLTVLDLVMTPGEFRTVNGTTYYFQKERIHNKLVSLAQLGLFFPVGYDRDSDMMGIDGLDTATVAPKSIETNETISRMGPARRNRTDGRRDRLSWTWELYLDFQEEVALEIFERELLSQPPILPRVVDQELQQVTLNLVDCGYSHPPEHESTSGTQAKLIFDAVLGPT